MAIVPPHTHPRHEHSQYLTLAEASAAGLFLPIAGGTLTGFLTLHAAPVNDLHASTKKYVDDVAATKSPTTHNHDAAYLSLAGGTVTGSTIFSAATTEMRQIYLHHPGVDHVKLESGTQSGINCLTVLNPSNGALAPIRIGSPVNAESAARVDWVQSDRAAASHGAHPARNLGTTVGTTDGAGQLWITHNSGGSGIPLVSNGDWPAMNRAPHIGAWDGASFRIDNLNANAAFRANWIVN